MYDVHIQVLTVSKELQRQKDELEQLIDLKDKGSMFYVTKQYLNCVGNCSFITKNLISKLRS